MDVDFLVWFPQSVMPIQMLDRQNVGMMQYWCARFCVGCIRDGFIQPIRLVYLNV